MFRSKKPPVRKFSGDGFFELRFERNWDLTPVIFCRVRLRGRAYWLLDVICQCTRARMTHQPQLHAWVVPCNVKRLLSKKEQKLKRFLKRNLTHVGMIQCMNALADKVQNTAATYVGMVAE